MTNCWPHSTLPLAVGIAQTVSKGGQATYKGCCTRQDLLYHVLTVLLWRDVHRGGGRLIQSAQVPPGFIAGASFITYVLQTLSSMVREAVMAPSGSLTSFSEAAAQAR